MLAILGGVRNASKFGSVHKLRYLPSNLGTKVPRTASNSGHSIRMSAGQASTPLVLGKAHGSPWLGSCDDSMAKRWQADLICVRSDYDVDDLSAPLLRPSRRKTVATARPLHRRTPKRVTFFCFVGGSSCLSHDAFGWPLIIAYFAHLPFMT